MRSWELKGKAPSGKFFPFGLTNGSIHDVSILFASCTTIILDSARYLFFEKKKTNNQTKRKQRQL